MILFWNAETILPISIEKNILMPALGFIIRIASTLINMYYRTFSQSQKKIRYETEGKYIKRSLTTSFIQNSISTTSSYITKLSFIHLVALNIRFKIPYLPHAIQTMIFHFTFSYDTVFLWGPFHIINHVWLNLQLTRFSVTTECEIVRTDKCVTELPIEIVFHTWDQPCSRFIKIYKKYIRFIKIRF